MKKNTITILTITFNSANFINRCFTSIINQTYTNWIWLIVDDGSTDDTEKIVKNLNCDKIDYHRLSKNQGRGRARNFAICKIKTENCAILDIDDLMLPIRLSCFNLAINEKYVGLISSVLLINHNNNITGQRNFIYNTSNHFTHASLCINTEILKRIRYSNSRYAEDQQLIYYISKLKGIKKINYPLYIYQEDANINLKGAFLSNFQALINYIPIVLKEKLTLDLFRIFINLSYKSFFLSLFFLLNQKKIYKYLINRRPREKNILIFDNHLNYLDKSFNIKYFEEKNNI